MSSIVPLKHRKKPSLNGPERPYGNRSIAREAKHPWARPIAYKPNGPALLSNTLVPPVYALPSLREERIHDEGISYPVVIVPSAFTRMVTPGKGLSPDGPDPATWLKPFKGSKMAPCAGQRS